MRPLKITFAIMGLWRGGAERTLAELANGLTERGHEVLILLATDDRIMYDLKCPVRRVSGGMVRGSDYPASDVIISTWYTLAPEAQSASVQGKGVHMRLSLCFEPLFLPDNSVSFAAYHMTPHVAVLSPWQQRLIELTHGIRAHVVPPGIQPIFKNLRLLRDPAVPAVGAIMRRMEPDVSGVKYSEHRNQEYLLQQLDVVATRYPDVEIHLCSPSSELSTCPRLAQLRKSGRYHFHLGDDDSSLCLFYNSIDVFVSSSTLDSFGCPGLEAMACGATLVTTYAGGNMAYCRPDENCLLSYRVEDRLGLDICRLIEDPQLRHQLAQTAEIDAQRRTLQGTLDAMEEALASIIGSAATPACPPSPAESWAPTVPAATGP